MGFNPKYLSSFPVLISFLSIANINKGIRGLFQMNLLRMPFFIILSVIFMNE